MASLTVSFSLDTERDTDLVAWLEKQDRRARSVAIREKLRTGIHQGDVSLADVLHEVREVKRLLRSGVVVSGANAEQEADPKVAGVKGKLAGLGL